MKTIAVTLAALSMTLGAAAQSAYQTYIARAVEGNPDIASQTAQIAADRATAAADNALGGPEIDFEHLWATQGSDRRWNAGISQELSVPALYKARANAADARAEASRLVLLSVKADKALSVKQLILDIVNANRRLLFYSDVAANLQRIADKTQRSFRLGNATILDVRKLQLAQTDNDRTVSEIKADIAQLTASLRGYGLTDLDSATTSRWFDYPAQALQAPTPDGEALLEAIRQAEIKAGQQQSRAVRLEAWPSLTVGYKHAYEERQHFNGIGISLTLPGFSQKKRREAAELQAKALELAAQDRATVQDAETQGLYNTAVELRGIMNQYRELSADNSWLELLRKAFEGGELNVIDYLNEVRLFAETRLGYLDMQYRYNLAVARLNRYKGMDF